MAIHYVSLVDQWQAEKNELLPIIERVLEKGHYLNSTDISQFEEGVSKLCNVKYAVALNSGTDALMFALALIGIRPGDEVITAPNSFIATAATIVHIGAKPIFVDVCDDQNINSELIEKVITEKTKAILPVHLTGKISNMNKIIDIGNKYNIPVIEDAAQAIGSKYNNKPSGSFGKVGCFSTHPLKNLNSCGDGGFITTDDKSIYEKAEILRSHGLTSRDKSIQFGYVSRMDSIQAAILNYRLMKLDDVISKRRVNAQFYFNNLNIFLKNKNYKFHFICYIYNFFFFNFNSISFHIVIMFYHMLVIFFHNIIDSVKTSRETFMIYKSYIRNTKTSNKF